MKLLLTSAGIKNPSIQDALVTLLEKPIAESRPLPPKRNTEFAMRESRQAFASIDPPAAPQSFFEFMAFGPRR